MVLHLERRHTHIRIPTLIYCLTEPCVVVGINLLLNRQVSVYYRNTVCVHTFFLPLHLCSLSSFFLSESIFTRPLSTSSHSEISLMKNESGDVVCLISGKSARAYTVLHVIVCACACAGLEPLMRTPVSSFPQFTQFSPTTPSWNKKARLLSQIQLG